jgi:hypothetical protein
MIKNGVFNLHAQFSLKIRVRANDTSVSEDLIS